MQNIAVEKQSVRGTRVFDRLRPKLPAAPCLSFHTPPAKSFLNAGVRSAIQVEFVRMNGDEGRHPRYKGGGSRLSGIVFVNMLSPAIVG